MQLKDYKYKRHVIFNLEITESVLPGDFVGMYYNFL